MVDDTQTRDVKDDSDDQTNVSRRGTLKGVGLGIAGISGITQIGSADDYVEVITEIGRNENATERVPREWYDCGKWVYGRTASSPAYIMHNNHGINFA